RVGGGIAVVGPVQGELENGALLGDENVGNGCLLCTAVGGAAGDRPRRRSAGALSDIGHRRAMHRRGRAGRAGAPEDGQFGWRGRGRGSGTGGLTAAPVPTVALRGAGAVMVMPTCRVLLLCAATAAEEVNSSTAATHLNMSHSGRDCSVSAQPRARPGRRRRAIGLVSRLRSRSSKNKAGGAGRRAATCYFSGGL